MNRINSLKRIDRFIGPVLLKILPPGRSQNKPAGKTQRILIVRPGGIGDAILLIPSLKETARKNPGVIIDILCEPRNCGIFESLTFINNTYNYQNPMVLITVMVKRYNILIDTEQSHYLSAIIARLSRCGTSTGFGTCGREKMYDTHIPYDHKIYEAVSFWNLFRSALNWTEHFSWKFPYFEEKSLPDDLPINIDGSVCLFPGGSLKSKQWPLENWVKIVEKLSGQGLNCILIGARDEEVLCQNIASECRKHLIVNLCSKLSLLETAHLFNRCQLLISTDSSILHLGVLSDIPTVSLFGPSIAAKWSPANHKHIPVKSTRSCRPCALFGQIPSCQNNYLCMTDIQPDDVVNTAVRLIKKKNEHHRL